jgi:osmotically-inducible protein OsmY
MNELQLQQAVIDELEFDPAVDAEHIGVFAAPGGVITLTGYVADYTQKHAAEAAARRVKGVRAIAQELQVRMPGHKQVADDEIATRAARILEWDLHLPPGAVSVTVQNGVVQLDGTVNWDFQRRAAEADVHKLSGVLAVGNRIEVRSSANPGQIQQTIRAAFERAADIESERISVQLAEDGAVVLSGQAHTMRERTAAENAAWSAPGVTRVVNRIEIF